MYKYIAILLIVLLSLYKAYDIGVEHQKGIEALARQELIDEQRAKVLALQSTKNKVEVKYRDKVKTIYKTVDPTGCLDRTLHDVGLLRAPADN